MADEPRTAKRVDFSGGDSDDRKKPNRSRQAPARERSSSTSSKRPPGRPRGLEGQLTAQFAMLGTFVSLYDRTDGEIIVANAEALAKVWADLANRNQAVKRALDRMMESAGYGQIAFAHLAVIVPILQNHGVLPSVPGFAAPDSAQRQRDPRAGEPFVERPQRPPSPHPPVQPATPDVEPPGFFG